MTREHTPELAILEAAEKAHAGEPISIEDIAEGSGVDVESIRLTATLMGRRGLVLVGSADRDILSSHLIGITLKGRVRLSRLRRTR